MKKVVFIAVICALLLGAGWTATADRGGSLSGPRLSTHIVTATDGVGGVDNEFKSVAALCDPGEVVTGGGMEVASINPDIAIVTNAPTEDFDSTGLQGWILTLAYDQPTYTVDFTAFAICAPGR